MLGLFDHLQNLSQNRLSPEKVPFIVAGLLGFAALSGLILIFTAGSFLPGESIYHQNVKALVTEEGLQFDRLDYNALKLYLLSIPFSLGRPLGSINQLLLMRAWGLIFLLLTMWLAYQTAKKVFRDDPFISLIIVAALASNNRLLASATTIGGDAFALFFFSLLVYQLVEIADKGAMIDIAIVLVLVFLLSKIDYLQADKVILPLLFLSLILAMAATYRERLVESMPKSTRARLGLAGGFIVLALVATTKIPLVGSLLFVPGAFVTGLLNLGAMPGIIDYLALYFADAAGLADGFSLMQQGLFLLYRVLAIMGVVGIGRLFLVAASERVQVVRKPAVALADGGADPGDGVQLTFVKPERSVLQDLNPPALLVIALLPLTVFAANNAYAFSGTLNERTIPLLVLPLALLLVAGLRQLMTVKSLEVTAAAAVIALLTVNTATMLVTALWR